MHDIYYFIISYALLLAIFFGLIQFLSNGFFSTFIRVKASRGKLVLVCVHSILGRYYKAGSFDGHALNYKNRNKDKKRILIDPKDSPVYRSMNVNCIDVDDETNNVLNKIFGEVAGHDAVKTDNLIVRALTRPVIGDKHAKIMLIIAIITVAVCVFTLFKVFTLETLLSQMGGTIR